MKNSEIIRNSQHLDPDYIFFRHLQGCSSCRLAKNVQHSISCSYPVALAYVRAVVLHHHFLGDDSNAPLSNLP